MKQSSDAPVMNVVYLERAANEQISENEIERLVEGLRRALGIAAVGRPQRHSR